MSAMASKHPNDLEQNACKPLRFSFLRQSSGFTLIEILIVVAIIALISSLMLSGFTSVFRASNESVIKQMALLMREARDRAMLTNKLIRLRVDLEKQNYWIEEAPASYMMPNQKPNDKSLTRKQEESLAEEDKNSFRLVKELTPEKRSLPTGLKISDVLSTRAKNPITEGTTDIFFFSNGNADAAVLHFETEEKNHFSILLHPITGQSKIAQGTVSQENK